jgi:hypothetical protein
MPDPLPPPSIRIATFGPKLPEIIKLYTQVANDPANDGLCTGISMAECLAQDWTGIDPLLALLPPGKLLRVAVAVTPADPNAGYDFVTLPLIILDKAPTDRAIAVMWGPNLEADYIQAHQNLYHHLIDLGIADQLEGFGLGGLCARIDDCEFSLCSSNPEPYQDFSQQWLDAGFTPEKVQGVLNRTTAAIAAIKPGQLLSFCFYYASSLTLGGRSDDGVWASSLFAGMMQQAGGSRLIPIYQSAEPGRPVPPVLAQMGAVAGGIGLQEKQGTVFNDPVPGALFLERHITDYKPGFVDQSEAQ